MIARSESKPVLHRRYPVPAQESKFDIAAIMGGIYGYGIIGMKGAFPREWVAKVGEEIGELYKAALKREAGAVGRGRNRHYVEIHPQDISGFVDLITHPWVTT